MHNLTQVSGETYSKWLYEYMLRDENNMPTHFYNYSVDGQDWAIANKDFKIIPLYGASSRVNIVVPTGINIEGERGHTSLFFMDASKEQKCSIPFYNDQLDFFKERNKKLYKKLILFIEEEREKERQYNLELEKNMERYRKYGPNPLNIDWVLKREREEKSKKLIQTAQIEKPAESDKKTKNYNSLIMIMIGLLIIAITHYI